MNFPAAVALAVASHDEPDAFAIFVALVHRLPADFFAEAPPLRGFQAELATLTALLEARSPQLLEAADGAVREALPLAACKWFLNMYVDTLPLATLLSVWDLLLGPATTTADNLSGQVIARRGELPEIRETIRVDVDLMATMVAGDGEAPEPIHRLRNNEMLMVNVATATSVGVVKNVEKNQATLQLRLPICADVGQRVSISRRTGSRWRLIGHATIV